MRAGQRFLKNLTPTTLPLDDSFSLEIDNHMRRASALPRHGKSMEVAYETAGHCN
jgi:hypothetical protein